ncbi:glutamate receptor 2.8-like [Musa acuminata AAA Group]|uniref:glutamate receptor 2.8-like n=1 Tax=Musa acuminata AAA Group TaxID=214697 RepID=UPI0031D9A52A
MRSAFHLRLPSLLPVLLLLLLSSSLSYRPRGALAAQFDVGVILDRKTWIGKISRTCMIMAVEDFYKANPDYTTRLSLHWRDTDNSSISAASAALDLLKNVRVQALIGPQTSTQAKFVAKLGDKAQVPIISFSATSPTTSSSQNPYFIRTAWNDSSQAQAIASLVEAFGWREVVPVYEDSEYGASIVPHLIDALQEVGANVPNRSMVPLSATTDRRLVLAELQKLNQSRTRVFVVHMSYSLAFRLFSTAQEAGMMGEGYVWITTYGLTDLVDLQGPAAARIMRGALGIRPYVRNTTKLQGFKARWRRRYHQESVNDNVTEPTVYGLWAYDTVWSLAMAAEAVRASSSSPFTWSNVTNSSTDLGRLGSSPTGPTLRELILNTTLVDGMSGRFEMVEDGQVLQSRTFEILNVADDGWRRVGFWTPTHGASRHMNKATALRVVEWPGGGTKPPKGWEWPTAGNKLIVGVPVKPGFPQFVTANNSIPDGYCIKVFEAVLSQLPYHVPIQYEIYKDNHGESNGTYDDLVYQVFLQKYDAVVGDVTIRANRSLYVDFTLPFTVSGVSMVVPIRDERRKDAWTFMNPLTPNLWFASGAAFVFTGLVVWFLEHRINVNFNPGRASNQIGTVFYFSFSTLVFAHQEKVLSNLARVVVVIWLFVVLILQSSYTASLTSMLTVQQLQPTVSDVDQLVRDGSKVGYLKDSFMPGLLKRLKFNESQLIAYESPQEYHDALLNGSVAAIVDEIPYLKVFLSKYCDKFTMVGTIDKTSGLGFAFPKGSPLVPDVSRAILNVTETNKTKDLENMLYGNTSCPDKDPDMTSSRLTFNSFWGLFLISGATSFSALILHLVFFLYEHRHGLQDGRWRSILGWLATLAKLYSQTDSCADAPEKAKPQDGTATGDIPSSPYLDSGWQTPSSISNHANGYLGSEDDTGTPPEEETPGREISEQTQGSPSFAEMLRR